MSCQFRIIDFNYVWQLPTVITATTEDPSFPVDNLKNFSRSYPLRTTSDEDQAILIDLMTAEEVDTFAIVFDPTVGSKLTSAAVITLQGSATNSWGSPGYSQVVTFDEDYQVYSLFLNTAQEYRYWRVLIDDPNNAYGYIEVPKIILGKATQLTRCPEIAFNIEYADKSTVKVTDYGHAYSDVYPMLSSLDISYKVMPDSDLDQLRESFELVGKTTPILACLDTDAEIFDKDRFIIYGRIDGNIKAKHQVRGLFDSSLSISEVI